MADWQPFIKSYEQDWLTVSSVRLASYLFETCQQVVGGLLANCLLLKGNIVGQDKSLPHSLCSRHFSHPYPFPINACYTGYLPQQDMAGSEGREFVWLRQNQTVWG